MTWASDVLEQIVPAYRAQACPSNAAAMKKYMRNQFDFIGMKMGDRRKLQRQVMAGLPRPASEGDLGELAGHLWELPERELQYAAVDIIVRDLRLCGPPFIHTLRTLITTKSWWDTVDGLAASCVGPLVRRCPELVATMDAWIEDENLWLQRTAILHQLGYKEATDTQRLDRYCTARAAEKDFFIRKAIGWALRQYSWTNPDWVSAFVAAHETELSGLSKREALLAINGGRKMKPGQSRAKRAQE